MDEEASDNVMNWETVIGLEVHAQLLAKTKLFCSCPITFGEEPNTRICPVCLGLPGSLPVLNEHAVELAVKAAHSLHCSINERSVFARKNYFYPDLPKGYQISQFDRPLAEKGSIEISTEGKTRKIGITRVHMEEDAGKLIHEGSEDESLVDYNRSCVPLIEIVSEPDISSAKEAVEYLRMLRLILIYNNICDGNMELGNLRCDANLSVRKVGEKSLGTKTELKNMNSFNFVQKALEYEEKRQIETLENGGKVTPETLQWDQKAGKTSSMRSKEEAHDYRYFSEPDLLPLKLGQELMGRLRSDSDLVYSETLITRSKELVEKLGIPLSKTQTIINSPGLAAILNKSLGIYPKNPLRIATLITDILPNIKRSREMTDNIPSYISEIVELEDRKEINLNTGKDLLEKSLKAGQEPSKIMEREGLKQVSDESSIDSVIDKILVLFKSQADEYRSGREGLFNFLLGQVMKESKGKVNPKIATDRLKEKLKQ